MGDCLVLWRKDQGCGWFHYCMVVSSVGGLHPWVCWVLCLEHLCLLEPVKSFFEIPRYGYLNYVFVILPTKFIPIYRSPCQSVATLYRYLTTYLRQNSWHSMFYLTPKLSTLRVKFIICLLGVNVPSMIINFV